MRPAQRSSTGPREGRLGPAPCGGSECSRRAADVRASRGIVLMEVIFALTLFTAGAATVLGAIRASTRAAQRLRVEAAGDDLVVTLLSELQMGLLPAEDDGPEPFEEEPYLGWTWQVVTSEFQDILGESPDLKRVQIVVSCPAEGYTRRLAVLVPDPSAAPAAPEAVPEDGDAGEEVVDPWEAPR